MKFLKILTVAAILQPLPLIAQDDDTASEESLPIEIIDVDTAPKDLPDPDQKEQKKDSKKKTKDKKTEQAQTEAPPVESESPNMPPVEGDEKSIETTTDTSETKIEENNPANGAKEEVSVPKPIDTDDPIAVDNKAHQPISDADAEKIIEIDTGENVSKAAASEDDNKPSTATKNESQTKTPPKGKKLTKIMKMQQALNAQGENIDIDGSVGKKTRAAIKRFQQKHNLKVTGAFDAATQKKLGVK